MASFDEVRCAFDALPREERQRFAAYVSSSNDGKGKGAAKSSGQSALSVKEVLDRFSVLGTLMVFQSLSSFILSSYQEFIEKNIYITLYLTMLVGAGGNAGNQSTVMVIRKMALGHIPKGDFSVIAREAWMALVLGVMMFVAGFARVYVFQQELVSTLAVAGSQFMIVVSSVVIGATLPLLLDHIGLDPAHAGPMIQVIMDVSGVLITCAVCSYVAGGEPGNTTSAISGSEAHITRHLNRGSSSNHHGYLKQAARHIHSHLGGESEDEEVINKLDHLLLVAGFAVLVLAYFLFSRPPQIKKTANCRV